MLQHYPDQFEPAEATSTHRHPRPLSGVLRELADLETGAVSVRDIRNALADRSFATFLVFTSSINLLPFPPGSTLLLGIPIVLVAMQMVLGYPTVWLPMLRSVQVWPPKLNQKPHAIPRPWFLPSGAFMCGWSCTASSVGPMPMGP